MFPDYWQEFIAPIPEPERHDLLQAHYRRLVGEDEIARMSSAKAWSVWEGRAATLLPNKHVVNFFATPRVALSLARIEAHYFVHDTFLEPNQILRDAPRLAEIPGVIVHGRYDMVCPLQNAWELQRAWPSAKLLIVPDAGHSAAEAGTTHALVKSAIEMAAMLGARNAS